MSIHGTQIRFPFAVDEKNKRELSLEATLAANYAQIQDMLQEDEELISFSHITWPFIFIQAQPSKHIMIDDIGLCKFKNKIINSPRTAQVGHVLRNADMEFPQRLKLIKEIIKFEKSINIEGETESKGGEFLNKEINGLVEPKLLDSFSLMISDIKKFQMNEMESLESLFSFDDALDYAQDYINTLEKIKGNQMQWKSLLSLIKKPSDEYLLDLKVKKKDVQERYESQIEKEKKLDENKIREKVNSAKDYADQWMVRKHKDIIQNIGKSFVNLDMTFQSLQKKNRYFINTDSLKTEAVGKVLQKAFKHTAHIRDTINQSNQELDVIGDKLNQIKGELEKTNVSADEKISDVSTELMSKKELQERRIQQLEQERDVLIAKIDDERNLVKDYWNSIRDIIENKIEECQYDINQVEKWQLDDEETNIQTPTVRYFLPVGIGIFEDEFEDEIIKIFLPSVIKQGLKRTPLSRHFRKFEKEIEKTVDRNMKIRSNFEFACERGNLIGTDLLKSKIGKGLNELKLLNVIEQDQIEIVLQSLN